MAISLSNKSVPPPPPPPRKHQDNQNTKTYAPGEIRLQPTTRMHVVEPPYGSQITTTPGPSGSPRRQQVNQRRYEALRAFFVDGLTYQQAADRFGYTRWAMVNLVRE